MADATESELGRLVPQLLEGARLPVGLQDLDQPPPRLFLHGVWPAGPKVAIVGTRQPTPDARQFARRLARDLARNGVVVASGGAEGIDAAAHLGALAAKAPTLVVAPCSLDRPYPAEHASLYRRVCRAGAFVTEHARGTRAHPNRFFRRNSLLVALSSVVVVVEAPLRSGTRNAAKWARQLSRPLLVVPSPPWNSQGRGCIEELRLGAEPLSSFKDVLKALERTSNPLASLSQVTPVSRSTALSRTTAAQPADRLLPKAQMTLAAVDAPSFPEGELPGRVRAALAFGPQDLDALARFCASEPKRLSRILVAMQLSGHVSRDGAGRYFAPR